MSRLYPFASLFIAAVLCLPSSVFAEKEREFTGSNGKSFRGKLVKVEKDTVTIKRTDGKVFTVAKTKFCEEDQTYFKEFASRPKKAEPFTMKDIRIFSYTTSFTGRKLEVGRPGVFDELKVSKGKRIRIHGKKKNDGGRVDGRVVNHMGKLVFFPAGVRTGKLIAKAPSLEDVRFYHMAIEFKETKDRKDAIRSRTLDLRKGVEYQWRYSVKDGQGVFVVEQKTDDGITTVATLGGSADEIVGIGFAATARWSGNEVDLSITEDVEED